MDSCLTNKHHFKVIRERCVKSMNVLKCVSRTSYGADRSTLLLLYRFMICSKLDYACFIYDQWRRTVFSSRGEGANQFARAPESPGPFGTEGPLEHMKGPRTPSDEKDLPKGPPDSTKEALSNRGSPERMARSSKHVGGLSERVMGP